MGSVVAPVGTVIQGAATEGRRGASSVCAEVALAGEAKKARKGLSSEPGIAVQRSVMPAVRSPWRYPDRHQYTWCTAHSDHCESPVHSGRW